MPSSPIPPAVEVRQIDKHLSLIDDELLRLKKQVAELETRARRMRERKRYLLPSVSWISRLPPDILGQIFTKGVQSSGICDELKDHRVQFPITVSQVNRQWRQVALNIPSLWTYLNMAEGRPYNRTISWIKRSKGLPLDIDIDYRDQRPEAYYQRNFLITLNVLIPFIHRWGTVRILAPSNLLETALHVFSAPAPNLHTLILRGWSTSEDDNTEHWSPTIFHKQTPRLERVYLHAIGLKWDTCVFDQMRDLTLSWVPRDTIFTLRELSQFLRTAAPSLQRLSIIGSSPRAVEDWPAHETLDVVLPYQVALPRLQELRLEALDLLDIQALIPLLHTPYLRKLSLNRIIKGSGRTGEGSPRVNVEAWRTSGWRPDFDKVEFLECVDVEFAGGLFPAVCKAAPGIKRFTLKGPSANAILEFLTPEPLLMLPEEDILLPALERVELHDVTPENLQAFINSRTSSLREIRGSIFNEKRLKRPSEGRDAFQQLGWEHNDFMHVAIRPVS